MTSDAGTHAGHIPERAPSASAQRARSTGERRRHWLLRWFALFGLTALSIVVAVAGTFAHGRMAHIDTVPVPYGLVLALLGLAAVLLLAHETAHSRLGVVPVATAWLLPVWLLAQERPAGDVVIASGWPGLTYLYAGVILIGVGIALPQR